MGQHKSSVDIAHGIDTGNGCGKTVIDSYAAHDLYAYLGSTVGYNGRATGCHKNLFSPRRGIDIITSAAVTGISVDGCKCVEYTAKGRAAVIKAEEVLMAAGRSSTPMTPPPITHMLSGTDFKERSPSLVRACSVPSIGRTEALEPVAITIMGA